MLLTGMGSRRGRPSTVSGRRGRSRWYPWPAGSCPGRGTSQVRIHLAVCKVVDLVVVAVGLLAEEPIQARASGQRVHHPIVKDRGLIPPGWGRQEEVVPVLAAGEDTIVARTGRLEREVVDAL